MALAAVNYLTNTLDQVNTQMALIPSSGHLAKEFQEERVSIHQDFATKLVDLANEIGEYMNNLDALGEEELSFVNPIFDFINEEGK